MFFFARSIPSHDQEPLASATAFGQNREFDVFFQKYERQITGYLYRMTGNEQLALDLSQETFLRAWRHFPSLHLDGEVRAWLFRVATNLALTSWRQRTTISLEDIPEEYFVKSDPSRLTAQHEAVLKALDALNPKQKSIMILHDVQGFSCEEIGEILKMSHGAIKMALWRGREQFRHHFLHQNEDA